MNFANRIAKAGMQIAKLKEREIYEGTLIDFAEYVWPVVEPAIPFVKGWAIEAIAEHLQAVTEGHIKRLLINVPPGFTKSLMTDVFWPAWEWGPRNMPHLRYVCASYSNHLTERDNMRCRNIVTSDLYQRMWGNRFKISNEQFTKIKFANNKTGWKLATSVGGIGVGERGDRFICLPYSEPILTSDGWLPIGGIVEQRLDVQVAGSEGWQKIVKYEKNHRTEKVLEIQFSGGNVRLTEGHPVWIENRGWIRAGNVRPGDIAISQDLSTLRDDLPGEAIPLGDSALLQPPMPSRRTDLLGQNSQQQTVCDVRKDDLQATHSSSAHPRTNLLFSSLPRSSIYGRGQSYVGWWPCREDLSSLWKEILQQINRKSAQNLLLKAMPGAGQAGNKSARAMRRMWQSILSFLEDCAFLLKSLCWRGPQQEYLWLAQRSLRPRRGSPTVSARMDAYTPRKDSSPRWLSMSDLWDGAEGSWESSLRASYRLQQRQSGPEQPSDMLQILPRQMAWPPEGTRRVAITSIGIAEEQPEWVYNVNVSDQHNYYASGLLVHNCDDANNTMDVESDQVRDTVKMWFTEVVPTRLNSPKDSAIIVIQQRLHEDDVSGIALSREMGFTHLCIPMEHDTSRHCVTVLGLDSDGNRKKWEDPRKDEFELAWPERFPQKVCDDYKRDQGPHTWAGQFQQSPEPRGGSIIKRDFWQLWEESKFPTFEYILGSVDTAYTDKEENDPSALTIWGVFRDLNNNPKMMLVYAWQERLQFHELLQKLIDTCIMSKVPKLTPQFPVDRLLIEAKASGISVGQELHRLIRATGAMGVELNPVEGDKYARLQSVQHLFSDEMIYAPDRKFADMVIDQCAVFPKGSRDDLVDSTSQALKYLRDQGFALRREEQAVVTHDEMLFNGSAYNAPLYGNF